MTYREKLESEIKTQESNKSWWTKDTTIGYLFCESELQNDQVERCLSVISDLRATLQQYSELQDPDCVDEPAQTLLSESFALIQNIKTTK